MTKYGSTTITYDAIGNPTKIGGYDLTWQGRELQSWSDDECTTIYYGYNADGIRTYKEILDDDTGCGTRYEYMLSGSQIIGETVYDVTPTSKTESCTVVYIYDESGSVIGMKYRTPSYSVGAFDYYFFEKNLQGDIIAVYSGAGTKLCTFKYDAWGYSTISYESGVPSATKWFLRDHCTFRYRGYYYDTETGFYYLQSRYYNPQWGRFLNADEYISTGQGFVGYNMFAYCGNNPILRSDITGDMWQVCPAMHPRNYFFGGAGGKGSMLRNELLCHDSTSYGTYLISQKVASYDAGLGSYYFDGSSSAVSSYDFYISSGLGVCFIEGTLIATEDGQKAIEDIEVGDLVWATDTEIGETALKEVVRLFRNETNEWIHITVNGEKITCTPEHPFYSPVKGWTSAVDLRAGDILVMLNGEYIFVEQVQHELLESSEITYNFEVKDFHTYYAGDTEVLVHNRCGKKVEFDGIPNSTKLKYGNNGKIYSATTYGPDGKIVAKIDFQGTEHYVKSVGKRILPHVHPYVNNNGYMHETDAITLKEFIISWGD